METIRKLRVFWAPPNIVSLAFFYFSLLFTSLHLFSLLFTFFHFFAVNLISGNIEVLRFNLPLLLFTYFHLFSLLFTSFQFCPCVEGGCLLWAGGPHLPVSSAQTSVGDEKCTRSQSLEPEHKLLTQKKIQQIKKRNKQQPTTRKLSGSISEAYSMGMALVR